MLIMAEGLWLCLQRIRLSIFLLGVHFLSDAYLVSRCNLCVCAYGWGRGAWSSSFIAYEYIMGGRKPTICTN